MLKKTIALLLCILMLLPTLPVFAAEDFAMRHIEFSATTNGTTLNGVPTLQFLFNPNSDMLEKLDVENVGRNVTDVYDDRMTVSFELKLVASPAVTAVREFRQTYDKITVINAPASPDTKMLSAADGRFALRITPQDMQANSPELTEWAKTHPNWMNELNSYARTDCYEGTTKIIAHYDRDGITKSAAENCNNCKIVTEQIIYTTSDGFSLSNASKWTSTTSWPGYNGSVPTYYGSTEGEYAQYKPHNLEEGWYDVYFWNMKCFDQQNPVKMTATVYSNGITVANVPLDVTTATVDKEGTWTKIGTYYFKGTNDEYMRLVSNGGTNARPADAKFVKNENYTPPAKVTSCHITTFSQGFSKSGTWTPGTFPDSTGNTTSGASYYGEVIGSYTQYTPSNLVPGWYDIYFWNLKYDSHQDPMKMTGTVYSNGVLTEKIELAVSTATTNRTGAWTKVGTYYFDGSNTEYFRLVSTYSGITSRPSDVKFEKNDSYVPPVELVTEQEIGYGDSGMTLSNESAWTATNWPAGTAYSRWHYYGNTLNEYVQYTPKNLEPGWYDITFWNMKCFDQQTPIKMTGTVYAGGVTRSNITLETTTATTDGDGVWTKAGTFYFAGTNDEYFRLVSMGKTNARPANVKFVKNDAFVPPPTIGDEKITLENENGVWSAEVDEEGVYTITVEKTAINKKGLLVLYVNGVVVDKQYSAFDETGIFTYGTYEFNKLDNVALKYFSYTSDSTIPAGKIYFEPAAEQYVKYELVNNQNYEPSFFFEAGSHTVKATITNNTGADKTYQLFATLTQDESFYSRTGDTLYYPTMKKLGTSGKVTVKDGETKVLEATVPVEKLEETTKIKAFIWNEAGLMVPEFHDRIYTRKTDMQTSAFTITPASCQDLGTWLAVTTTEAVSGAIFSGTTTNLPATTKPAVSTFTAVPGEYRVWVRTKNFTDRPNLRFFNLEVNGTQLSKTLGQVGKDGYFWEDAGTVTLDGKTTVKLLDTSAQYAKCDAILFNSDLTAQPPSTYDQLNSMAPIIKTFRTELKEENMMADFTMDKDFPGGNYKINYMANDVIEFSPDLYDTGGTWFYWSFKATSEKDRTVTFKLSGCDVLIGNSGVLYSTDDGQTWDYMSETAKGTEFSYDFEAGKTVWFSCVYPYQVSHLNAYLDSIRNKNNVEVSTLCKTEEGRDVPLIVVGNKTAPNAVFFTARHHSCESTASYMLEGVIDYLISVSDTSELFDNYCFYIVPMIDVDGVENGDQGKNRLPHDHNRDYVNSIYAPVKGVMALAETLDVEFAMDFHCPYLQDYGPYFSYSTDVEDEILAFHEMLIDASEADTTPGKILYEDGWNRPDSAVVTAQMKGWFNKVLGAPFSATFEFPYSGDVGDEYTPERMINFGILTGGVIEDYLLK